MHSPNTVFGAVAQSASYHASGEGSISLDILYDRERDCITLPGRVVDDVATLAELFPRLFWHVGMEGLKQKTELEISWLEGLQTLSSRSRIRAG